MMFTVTIVEDLVAQRHLTPMFSYSPEEAKRTFRKMVETDGTPIYDSPQDFRLWYLGQWNSQSGEFEFERPELLMDGKEFTGVKNGTA